MVWTVGTKCCCGIFEKFLAKSRYNRRLIVATPCSDPRGACFAFLELVDGLFGMLLALFARLSLLKDSKLGRDSRFRDLLLIETIKEKVGELMYQYNIRILPVIKGTYSL